MIHILIDHLEFLNEEGIQFLLTEEGILNVQRRFLEIDSNEEVGELIHSLNTVISPLNIICMSIKFKKEGRMDKRREVTEDYYRRHLYGNLRRQYELLSKYLSLPLFSFVHEHILVSLK